MKFYYKDSIRIKNLVFSISWLILGVLWLLTSNVKLFGICYIVLGGLYFFQFYIQKTKPLIVITEDSITKILTFRKKTIAYKEITRIINPFGDFSIKSNNLDIHIPKEALAEDSYILLKEQLRKIQIQRGF